MTESQLNDRLTDEMKIPLEAVINRQQPRPQEQESPWTKWVLLSMTTIVFAGSLVWAFFSERPEYLDDLALFSAAYTHAHGGVVTYPVQGEFHSMVVQPPLHYWMLGSLIRAGLPAYYAEAIAPLFFLLLGLFLVWNSRFSVPVRVGLLLALCVPFLFHGFQPHVRPDIHRGLALFAGLIALEDGRLRNWNLGRLFVGSLLLTYASALHYPGFLAWTGVLVYVVWVLIARGWRFGWKPIVVLTAGGCTIGIPYLLFFVIPHWTEIIAVVRQVAPTGSLASCLKIHRQTYAQMYSLWPMAPWLRILFYPLKAGIPLIAFSTIGLLVPRETRGLAFASLPYPLFLLTRMTHKLYWAMYFLPEFMLYVAGTAVLGAIILRALGTRIFPSRRLPIALYAGLLAIICLVVTSPAMQKSSISFASHVHEAEIAHAAGRAVVGRNALVGSARGTLWYASGATHYYDVSNDLLSASQGPDLTSYFAAFDAIILERNFSAVTENPQHKSLTSWYADGTLNLRGFYLTNDDTLPYLILSGEKSGHIEGHVKRKDGLIAHFRDELDGSQEFVAALCDLGALSSNEIPASLWNSFLLPTPDGSLQQEIVVFVSERGNYLPFRRSLLGRCRIRDEVPLNMTLMKPAQLLATLKDDQVVKFYEHYEDAVDARWGPEGQATVGKTGWPESVTFNRGAHKGKTYFLDRNAQTLFHSDLDSTQGLDIVQYESKGRFQIQSGGLLPDDHSGMFYPSTTRDHIASQFFNLSPSSSSLTFFSVWVKPSHGNLPAVSVQDEHYSFLVHARSLIRREDGWTLMMGWAEVPSGGRIRLAIEPQGNPIALDKAEVMQCSGLLSQDRNGP